jgi:hypothetical protein
MRWRNLSLLLSLCLGWSRPATAVICTADAVPAATLLLPYFEVDLGDPDGANTLFSINNASDEAVLAHVVVWSDVSVPVLDFNVYLTGYDVQSVNLRDLLVRGVLPRTASAGQDPVDAISPRGVLSTDLDFASCTGQLPLPDLPSTFLAHLQAALTGRFSSVLGGCASFAFEGARTVAQGYVTVDTVNNCTLRFPGDAGYFASGGNGDATNQNVLWGDFFLVDPGKNLAQGFTLVHIEADGTNAETSVPGQYTFYGRYVGWTAVDNREPLPTTFVTRFVNGGAFSGGTDLLYWRDSKVAQGVFRCNTAPNWYGLGQEMIVIFDEEENLAEEEPVVVSPLPLPDETFLTTFPKESGRIAVGSELFPVNLDFGWIYTSLNHPAVSFPPEDPFAAQGWLMTVSDAEGRFGVGFDAVHLDSACAAIHTSILE